MRDVIYNVFRRGIGRAKFDLVQDDIRVMLVGEKYQPDAAHETRAQVTDEIKADGYTPGGKAVPGRQYDITPADEAIFRAENVEWHGTISARGCVLYKSRGAASLDELIVYFDFGETVSSTNDRWLLPWPESGILNLI